MNKNAKLVIIETPYTAPTEEGVKENERYARMCMLDSLKRGEFPLASHLIYPQVLDDSEPAAKALGIKAGLAWGAHADATIVYSDRGVSKGMLEGILRAQEDGRPVVFRSLDVAPRDEGRGPVREVEQPLAGKWLTIETAPKDGTAVLVMRDLWPGTKSGRAEKCSEHNTYVAAWWGGARHGLGAWICYMDATSEPECPVEPTHWMPLPSAPSEKGGE